MVDVERSRGTRDPRMTIPAKETYSNITSYDPASISSLTENNN